EASRKGFGDRTPANTVVRSATYASYRLPGGRLREDRPARGHTARLGGNLDAELPRDRLGGDLAVLRRRHRERVPREARAVPGGEHLRVAGAPLGVRLRVPALHLDAERGEEREVLLLPDRQDHLVGGQHELAARHGLGPAAPTLVGRAERHAHAPDADDPAALAEHLDGLRVEPDVDALVAHERDLVVVRGHLLAAAPVD